MEGLSNGVHIPSGKLKEPKNQQVSFSAPSRLPPGIFKRSLFLYEPKLFHLSQA